MCLDRVRSPSPGTRVRFRHRCVTAGCDIEDDPYDDQDFESALVDYFRAFLFSSSNSASEMAPLSFSA